MNILDARQDPEIVTKGILEVSRAIGEGGYIHIEIGGSRY